MYLVGHIYTAVYGQRQCSNFAATLQQLCRAFVPVKRIDAGHIQIGQPLVLNQQKQESLTCFIRFYLTVRVRILIPKNANFNDATNRLTVSRLQAYAEAPGSGCSGGLEIYMTEKMLHAKLLMNEQRVIIGSCNINRKSFTRLDELAVSVDNDDSPFAAEIRKSLEQAFRNAECVGARDRIRYNPVLAALETVVM